MILSPKTELLLSELEHNIKSYPYTDKAPTTVYLLAYDHVLNLDKKNERLKKRCRTLSRLIYLQTTLVIAMVIGYAV